MEFIPEWTDNGMKMKMVSDTEDRTWQLGETTDQPPQSFGVYPQTPGGMPQQHPGGSCSMPFDIYQQQQYVAEQQMKLQTEYQKEVLRAELEDMKDTKKLQRREAYEEHRLRLREEYNKRRSLEREAERERKRSIYEELEIDKSGKITLVTRNLAVQTVHREVTNITLPEIVILARIQDPDERVFKFRCKIGDRPISMFLDGNKLSNGAYIIRKFLENGIRFRVPERRFKEVVRQLLAKLFEEEPQTRYLADKPGWVRCKGKWFFIEEGALTWEDLKRKI